MSVKPIPDGYNTITPYLVSRDANALVTFITEAFSATVLEEIRNAEGQINHAELRIGNSMIMVGGKPDAEESNAMLYLYVEDVDKQYQQALEAGAVTIMPPTNMFYGDRNAGVKDAMGNKWWIATRIENLTQDELSKRAKEAHANE